MKTHSEPSTAYRIGIMAGWLSYMAVLGCILYAVWHYAPMAFDMVKRLQ